MNEKPNLKFLKLKGTKFCFLKDRPWFRCPFIQNKMKPTWMNRQLKSVTNKISITNLDFVRVLISANKKLSLICLLSP